MLTVEFCAQDVGFDNQMHSTGSCYMRVQTTVLMAVIVSSTITGLALFGMGKLRMGAFISFVPFPVQCAFLAACGFKVYWSIHCIRVRDAAL